MKLRYLKLVMVGGALTATLAVGISLALATGVTIHPEGNTALMTNVTPVTFTIGSATITCEQFETRGTIAKPLAASMKLWAPAVSTGNIRETCTTSGLEGKTAEVGVGGKRNVQQWELTASSKTAGSLVMHEGFAFNFGGTSCHVRFSSKGPESLEGTWANGFWSASTFKLGAATTKVLLEPEKEGAKCLALEAGGEEVEGKHYNTAKVSGTFEFNDVTNLEPDVHFSE